MIKKDINMLIVDDSQEDLYVIGRYIENIPDVAIHCSKASSWVQAKELLSNLEFDIILLDYNLGEITALEIIENIRMEKKSIPVIVMTGQGNERIAAKIIKAGADDYMIKGDMNSEVLRISINSSLEKAILNNEKLLLSEELISAHKLEAVGTLAGGMAHDFNNYLTGILSLIEISILKNNDLEVENHLVRTRELCVQMSDVIKKLLVFSKRGYNSSELFSCKPCIDKLITLLKDLIPQNINLTINSSLDNAEIHGNRNEILRAIMLLVANSIDAMPDGGNIAINISYSIIDENLKYESPYLESGKMVCIEINDSGCGIDPKIQSRIFEPFFTTKELNNETGRGLGLSIVRQTVWQHKGIVSFSSKVGEGTTFKVYLPVGISNTDDSDWQVRPYFSIENSDVSILFVDDNMTLREYAADILPALGYKVILAKDGEQAIEQFSLFSEQIDVVILDLNLPGIDGKTCLERMKKINPEVPIYIATGNNTSKISNELYELGALGIFEKPFRFIDIVKNLKK
jgi:signal transduction histidine kinase